MLFVVIGLGIAAGCLQLFFIRKEMLSPGAANADHHFSPFQYDCCRNKSLLLMFEKRHSKCASSWQKAFLLTSPGSLTIEAAIVVPLFAAGMAAVLQFTNVYTATTRLGSILTAVSEEMAIAAYADEYSDSESPIPAALSAGYASARVMASGGNMDCIRGQNLLLSSFLEEDEKIDLILTYHVQSPSGLLKIPWIVFVQRAAVRGWVGRNGSGNSGEEAHDHEHEQETVYVTEYGQVYHIDPNCTHIHLSIKLVTGAQAQTARNVYGEKYHACEKCGGGDGGAVYITSDGNRYHSSLECSGLKRTIREMTKEEAGDLRPCSKCAAG